VLLAIAATVICSELYRQGIIGHRMRRPGLLFAAREGFDVYRGYRILADPIVERMQRSKGYTRIVAFLAVPTLKEMAYRLGYEERGTLRGKLVLAIGIPLCRWANRRDGTDIASVREAS